jgi:hypothetical protein
MFKVTVVQVKIIVSSYIINNYRGKYIKFRSKALVEGAIDRQRSFSNQSEQFGQGLTYQSPNKGNFSM